MVMNGWGALVIIVMIILLGMAWHGIATLVHKYIYKHDYEVDEDVGKSYGVAFPIVLIVAIFVGIWFFTCPTEVKLKGSWNIYAIKDSTLTSSGRSGVKNNCRYYFEEDMNYFYLANYKDGQKMYNVDKNKSYIVEDDKQTPHIEEYVNVYKNQNSIFKYFWDETIAEHKIIVPKSTMTNEFKIDMEK